MAILAITRKEIEKAKRPEEGWYLAEIVKAEEQKAKPKEGKPQGMNMVHSIQLLENMDTKEDYREREKEKNVYIPLSDDGLKSFNFPYVEAVLGKPIEELEGYELDMEKDFLGKQIYVQVKHDIYKKNESDKGMETWEFVEFRPTTAPPF